MDTRSLLGTIRCCMAPDSSRSLFSRAFLFRLCTSNARNCRLNADVVLEWCTSVLPRLLVLVVIFSRVFFHFVCCVCLSVCMCCRDLFNPFFLQLFLSSCHCMTKYGNLVCERDTYTVSGTQNPNNNFIFPFWDLLGKSAAEMLCGKWRDHFCAILLAHKITCAAAPQPSSRMWWSLQSSGP